MRRFRVAAARLAISLRSCRVDMTMPPFRHWPLIGNVRGTTVDQHLECNVAYSRFVAQCLHVMMPDDGRRYSGSGWKETPEAAKAAGVDTNIPR